MLRKIFKYLGPSPIYPKCKKCGARERLILYISNLKECIKDSFMCLSCFKEEENA